MVDKHYNEPPRAEPWWAHALFAPVVIGLCVAFVALGTLMLVGPHLSSSPPASQSASTGPKIEAYIVGAVVHPGVYSLPITARVNDLLQAAGGARQGADLVRVNLAAPLFDGEEVYVPLIGEPYPDLYGTSGVCVNINLASATALHIQLGIEIKTADAIVAYRQAHGLFTGIDQLLLVPVSSTVYNRIKALICV
jgi:competence protein ComEA